MNRYYFNKILAISFSELITDMSKLERIALLRNVTKHLVNFYNYAWLFLEIHMQKIVFISFVLLCINDVSKIITIRLAHIFFNLEIK